MTVLSFILVVIVVAAGCRLTYVAMQRSSRLLIRELQQAADRQFASLNARLGALESQIQQLSKATAIPALRASRAPDQSASKPAPVQVTAEEITPDLLVVMAAAVTAFLGKKVRIRSAKALQSPYEIVNPWSQQGRVIVQASHNLRPTG